MPSKFKRILLKLSGESLMGTQSFGIDNNILEHISSELFKIAKLNIEIGIVIGGGNIYRGLSASQQGVDRSTGDQMGMLATVINSLALQNSLEKIGIHTRVQSAIKMDEISVISAVNIEEAEILVRGSSSSVFPCISLILFKIKS